MHGKRGALRGMLLPLCSWSCIDNVQLKVKSYREKGNREGEKIPVSDQVACSRGDRECGIVGYVLCECFELSGCLS